MYSANIKSAVNIMIDPPLESEGFFFVFAFVSLINSMAKPQKKNPPLMARPLRKKNF